MTSNSHEPPAAFAGPRTGRLHRAPGRGVPIDEELMITRSVSRVLAEQDRVNEA
jgi:hypothetical protein